MIKIKSYLPQIPSKNAEVVLIFEIQSNLRLVCKITWSHTTRSLMNFLSVPSITNCIMTLNPLSSYKSSVIVIFVSQHGLGLEKAVEHHGQSVLVSRSPSHGLCLLQFQTVKVKTSQVFCGSVTWSLFDLGTHARPISNKCLQPCWWEAHTSTIWSICWSVPNGTHTSSEKTNLIILKFSSG